MATGEGSCLLLLLLRWVLSKAPLSSVNAPAEPAAAAAAPFLSSSPSSWLWSFLFLFLFKLLSAATFLFSSLLRVPTRLEAAGNKPPFTPPPPPPSLVLLAKQSNLLAWQRMPHLAREYGGTTSTAPQGSSSTVPVEQNAFKGKARRALPLRFACAASNAVVRTLAISSSRSMDTSTAFGSRSPFSTKKSCASRYSFTGGGGEGMAPRSL
mmetsp:Transcript_21305/g.38747  ORF Transcript_21305/g.38747 Transcript_21305/m.38747 type:complete len:210 (+) Transcript_21305:1542-2171(+)